MSGGDCRVAIALHFAVPQVSIRKLKEIHTLTHPARKDRSH